jgi:hypothetical protein
MAQKMLKAEKISKDSNRHLDQDTLGGMALVYVPIRTPYHCGC